MIVDPDSAGIDSLSGDGIVVVGVGEDDGMHANSVPVALVERLGPDATTGLLPVFELERRTSSDEC